MAPLQELPPWIPEDDLLLKNAVEAGASLESLAKGAVRFSRRYSLAELRERWHSLLYDPVVSQEGAAAMAKLELAKSNFVGIMEISAAGGGGGRKRKARPGDSVRRKYYAMRKKLCNEFFYSLDMSLHSEMQIENENKADVVAVAGSDEVDDNLDIKDVNIDVNNSNLTVNSLVDCGNSSGLEKGGVGPSHSNSTNDVPLLKIIEDVSAPSHPLGSSHGDVGFVADPGKEVQFSERISHPEPGDGFMFCRLNTEDPDIPSNDLVKDTVNISTVVSHPAKLKSHSIVKEVGYPDLYICDQRRNEPVGSLKKEDIPPHSFEASQTVPPGLVANASSSNSPVGVVPRTEILSNSRLVHATSVHASDGLMEQEEVDAPASVNVYAHPHAQKHKALPDQRGGGGGGVADDDEDGYDDSYDAQTEIPRSSEAEAMILEMDLSPSDEDTNASREVLKYQDDETKRTIMRLEQCASSVTHRGIASQGALAVLYGHKTKQYIKKSEVILGRATDDFHVDIDLSREGPANKVSRRQASIKLEENGSFIITNYGKSSILVNGNELPKGKLRGLRSNSLIEIKDLSFMFVVYDKCVKKFIEDVYE